MYNPLLTLSTMYLHNAVKTVIKDERGQDLAEYALLLVFIAVACIVGVTALGGRIMAIFTELSGSL